MVWRGCAVLGFCSMSPDHNPASEIWLLMVSANNFSTLRWRGGFSKVRVLHASCSKMPLCWLFSVHPFLLECFCSRVLFCFYSSTPSLLATPDTSSVLSVTFPLYNPNGQDFSLPSFSKSDSRYLPGLSLIQICACAILSLSGEFWNIWRCSVHLANRPCRCGSNRVLC